MSVTDLKRWVKFARAMLSQYSDDIWQNGIAFYLDGVSFVHKTNPLDQAKAPSGRIWRKKSEGLLQGCTSKGSKVGHGGMVAHYLVAISYGQGVLVCQQYEKMNGKYFSSFVDEHFPILFAKSGKETHLFIQDGDPSQNSKVVRESMQRCRAELLAIPARSPDINPIENIFHSIRNQLTMDAINEDIQHETYEEFCTRVTKTVMNFPASDIDRTIESMSKRMRMLIANNGQRLKY